MAHVNYDKLVRDRIPEIIRDAGGTCSVDVMDEATHIQYLLRKVLEEADELARAPEDERVQELADLCEVLAALMDAYGLSGTQVEAARLAKYAERGGFTRRLRLLWTDE